MLGGWRNIGKIVLEPLHPCLMKWNTFRFRRENEAIKKINAGEGGIVIPAVTPRSQVVCGKVKQDLSAFLSVYPAIHVPFR